MKSLILADIHANLAALEAVLEFERSWDEVIFLGDAIVTGPQPEEVVTRLRGLEGIWIQGNHDLEPFKRRFEEAETNPDRAYMRWTRDQISEPNRRFLEGFEPSRPLDRQGLRLRLHHGHFPHRIGRTFWTPDAPRPVRLLARIYARAFLPPSDSRIWPDSPGDVFARIAGVYREPHVLLAHSHVQFQREVGGTVFLNPGSVGQPRLAPLAQYAVLQDGRFDLRAVPYDTEATCRALDRVEVGPDVAGWAGFITAWKDGYRAGRLPERYRLRDWQTLIDQGYR